MRIGIGYDVHVLTENRRLVLGGVEIPYEKGLLGNSDADVLVHAIMDAMLGAAALGDLGHHFPDDDETYKDADSIELLYIVCSLLQMNGYHVHNIDSVVIAQRPKLAPYVQQMRQIIADAVQLDLDRVNVKATTEEHLGFTGRGEGIAAQAVVLLEEDDK